MFKTSQDAYTSAQRQSNESQESRETSAELSCDHRSTSATSERCNRNITRYKMYNLQSGRLILTTFLNDGTSTETCIYKRRVLIQKEEDMTVCYFATIEQLSNSIWCQNKPTIHWPKVSTWESIFGLHFGWLVAQIRSKSGHMEKLDILRKWSATILLSYSFTISYGGLVASLLNRTI